MMRSLQLATIAEAHTRVPVKTGNLARSIEPGRLTDTEAQVIARARYAAYVEHGTRPHIIRPRNRKALRFAANAGGRRLSGRPRVGASVVFATIVHHPGTKPQPYLIPAAKAAVEKGGLKDIIVAEWNGAA